MAMYSVCVFIFVSLFVGANAAVRKSQATNANSKSENDIDNSDLPFWATIMSKNPKRTPDGDMIIEGDMVVPPNGTEEEVTFRKNIGSRLFFWPRNTVYYDFHYSVSEEEMQIIEKAIKECWEENTCLKFKRRDWFDFWYLRFRTDMEGCWSLVGRNLLRLGGQDLNIGQGCATRDTVCHEIGHAIGFFHEQSRSDRDETIQILWENVLNGLEPQFAKARDNPEGVPYDLTSIMQYPSWAFSKYPFEKNTIVTRNPLEQPLMAKYDGLSFRDKKLANIMYKCDSECPNKNKTICENEGYLAPYKGKGEPCPCVCPPGTSGERCEEITGTYYPPLSCGGNLTEEGEIQTPGFPNREKPFQSCSWVITAPSGKKVELEVEKFSIAPRLNRPGHPYNNKCVFESMEIRTKDLTQGEMFCGEDIKSGTKFTSPTNKMIILIIADNKMRGEGLKGNVKFI